MNALCAPCFSITPSLYPAAADWTSRFVCFRSAVSTIWHFLMDHCTLISSLCSVCHFSKHFEMLMRRDFWRSCCNASFWGDVRRHKKKPRHAKSSTNIIFEVKRFSILRVQFQGKGNEVCWLVTSTTRSILASVFIFRGNIPLTNWRNFSYS